jgi:hypothetical protein
VRAGSALGQAAGPRFDDVDTNREGIVTLEELQRFIEKEYGPTALTARR